MEFDSHTLPRTARTASVETSTQSPVLSRSRGLARLLAVSESVDESVQLPALASTPPVCTGIYVSHRRGLVMQPITCLDSSMSADESLASSPASPQNSSPSDTFVVESPAAPFSRPRKPEAAATTSQLPPLPQKIAHPSGGDALATSPGTLRSLARPLQAHSSLSRPGTPPLTSSRPCSTSLLVPLGPSPLGGAPASPEALGTPLLQGRPRRLSRMSATSSFSSAES